MSSAHQVITGALNHGESMFANGSVEGINFTVCHDHLSIIQSVFAGMRCWYRRGYFGVKL